ncbi:MAG TPA: hypothetical protein DEP84_01620 [Chloroflexi bacterium]|nr:hypothetical protein [Chloroflexota bacterium]
MRNILIALLLLLTLLLGGTVLARQIEHLSTFDALYYTVTVLSTVGFGDITPKTGGGKWLFIGLALVGLATYGYIVSTVVGTVTEAAVRREVLGLRGRNRMENHCVLIGWDGLGEVTYNELHQNGVETVVLVSDELQMRELRRHEIEARVGDPQRIEDLSDAGIAAARAVVFNLPNETDNLLALLKVKRVNPRIQTVVVSRRRDMEGVYQQAGADRVVYVADIGGRLVASTVFEPAVARVLLDLAEAATGLDLAQVTVDEQVMLRGLKNLSSDGSCVAVAIERERELIPYPNPDTPLRIGDTLVLLGPSNETRRAIQTLRGAV